MLNYRPSVNLRNQWLQQDHRNFTIGAEKGMSMLQCPVLHPLKIMDPSSCFHSSMNFIWHGHRQKPDQTPQNISKWRSMFFSEKSNQIWAKCLAALTQLAFTHHLFLAAHKCGWKQSCTNSKLYKKKKISLPLALTLHTLHLILLCPRHLLPMDCLIQHSSERGQSWSLVKELMSCRRGCAAVPTRVAVSNHTAGTPAVSSTIRCKKVLEDY